MRGIWYFFITLISCYGHYVASNHTEDLQYDHMQKDLESDLPELTLEDADWLIVEWNWVHSYRYVQMNISEKVDSPDPVMFMLAGDYGQNRLNLSNLQTFPSRQFVVMVRMVTAYGYFSIPSKPLHINAKVVLEMTTQKSQPKYYEDVVDFPFLVHKEEHYSLPDYFTLSVPAVSYNGTIPIMMIANQKFRGVRLVEVNTLKLPINKFYDFDAEYNNKGTVLARQQGKFFWGPDPSTVVQPKTKPTTSHQWVAKGAVQTDAPRSDKYPERYILSLVLLGCAGLLALLLAIIFLLSRDKKREKKKGNKGKRNPSVVPSTPYHIVTGH